MNQNVGAQDCSQCRAPLCLCSELHFQCELKGGCIDYSNVCDGVEHCSDASDEIYCSALKCNENQFRCSIDECIESSRQCDFNVDCYNGADEKDCLYSEDCKVSGMFHCPQSYCIPSHMVCNGINDCPDGEDESDCPKDYCAKGYYRCGAVATGCIHPNFVCDGVKHCPNVDDEEKHCNEPVCSE
ncbi:hypothetical protein CAPTEDRAFT_139117, partial [Capitella teleta]